MGLNRELLWTGRCRIYFNAYEEGPLFWSVDEGTTATEVKCTDVAYSGSGFYTVVNAGSKVQPRAWIEVDEAEVSIQGAKVYVAGFFG